MWLLEESSQVIPSHEQQSTDGFQFRGETEEETLPENHRRDSWSWWLQPASETVRNRKATHKRSKRSMWELRGCVVVDEALTRPLALNIMSSSNKNKTRKVVIEDRKKTYWQYKCWLRGSSHTKQIRYLVTLALTKAISQHLQDLLIHFVNFLKPLVHC